MEQKIIGNVVDVIKQKIYLAELIIVDDRIHDIYALSEQDIKKNDADLVRPYLIPAFVDAHIHIESSMLPPAEFARMASIHGTLAAVCDPHEIANVMGKAGIEFMLKSASKVPFYFFHGVPACVPATNFETSGAKISTADVEELLKRDEFYFLSEMMNFPGVVFDDPEVVEKLKIAKKLNKPIDGHAPLLTGKQLKKYVNAGIFTDHECSNLEEAREKASLGVHIMLREGSAAKNFEALLALIAEYPTQVMFCSDDKHPDDLLAGHINLLVKRAIQAGYDPLTVLSIASLNPIRYYGLPVGLLQKNDFADFLIVDNLSDLTVLETYYHGQLIAKSGKSFIQRQNEQLVNNFFAQPLTLDALNCQIPPSKENNNEIRVIDLVPNELITKQMLIKPLIKNNNVISDPERDILKLVVLNRYQVSKPAIGFVHGFQLKHGAMASSISHDSHNLIAVGTSDEEILKSLNLIIKTKGGICCLSDNKQLLLPLPIAGLMSNAVGDEVARQYIALNQFTAKLGIKIPSPFMTLSFLALLVIPQLKLCDLGLFDGNNFNFISLWN